MGRVTSRPKLADASTIRSRMTGKQQREQLLEVGRKLFAEKGFEGTTVEEIAAKAGVSKPVVYEHFGGKEGLYAVVVDREILRLLDRDHRRPERPDDPSRSARGGRDVAAGLCRGVEGRLPDPRARLTGRAVHGLVRQPHQRCRIAGRAPPRGGVHGAGLDPRTAPLYAQMLVGMVALTGQWWLDSRKFKKADVAAHLVNLAWNGLSGLEAKPSLRLAH